MRIRPDPRPLLPAALLVAIAFIIGAASFEGFGSRRVIADLPLAGSGIGIAAIGATFVILTGGIDLSAGSVIAASGALFARLVEREGVPPGIAIVAVIGAGLAFGAVQGTIVERFRQPPFLVTLAGLFSARALGFLALPASLAIHHPGVAEASELGIAIGGGARLGAAAILWLALSMAASLTLGCTRVGRSVVAIGSDRESARLMGVPVAVTGIGTYAAAGALSATAGLSLATTMQSGNPAAATGLELDIIAAVVIGGTRLSGGLGGVGGTVLAVLLLQLIQTLLAFEGTLSSWWSRIAIGGILLAFLVAQRSLGRHRLVGH